MDKECKTPKIRNNYKGETTLPFIISSEDLSKIVLASGAFVCPLAVPALPALPAAVNTVPRPSIVVPAVMPWAIPKHRDHEKWKSALKPNENILATSLVIKPNPMGLQHKRQLILIVGPSGPRLVYLDPKSMEVKGEVEWTKASPPTVYAGSKVVFEIAVSKRVYKFTDNDNGAEFWIKHINDAIKMFS